MKSPRSALSKYLLFVLAASLCCIGPSMMANEQSRSVNRNSRNAGVAELRNLNQLKDAFQRDIGKVRLIALLSPT